MSDRPALRSRWLPPATRSQAKIPEPWMGPVLRAAGIYNLLWGAAVVLLPRPTLWLAGFDSEQVAYPQLWQCIGMIVGVYGVGYWTAARDAYRHWPVVLVGFLGKTFGPIGAVQGIVEGSLPVQILWTNLFNDLIWWIPFLLILIGAARAAQVKSPTEADAANLRGRFAGAVADGRTLVLFLRHAGCTFCREAIADLNQIAGTLHNEDLALVLVLPDRSDGATLLAAAPNLSGATLLGDPSGVLAADHGLPNGGFDELFGPAVWGAGARACLIDRHGVGKLAGNGFQMPGLFLYEDGQRTAEHRHATAAERPDYLAFIRNAVGPQQVETV